MTKPRGLSNKAYATLPTERVLAAAEGLDTFPAKRIVSLLASEEERSVRAVNRVAARIARAARTCARSLEDGGRIVYVGAGTSGRLAALDAAECPPTFGVRPSQVVAVVAGGPRALRRAVEGAEDRGDDAVRALTKLRLGPKDTMIAIAASGVTPFARAALLFARHASVPSILITCAPMAARAGGARADLVIGLDVGPEVIAGSTRLKAGTATKITLNAISTTAMVLLGKCYGPRMVDLRAGSAKLRARAQRIVVEVGQVPGDRADDLLAAAHGNAKIAIVMARLGVSRKEAEVLLHQSAGRLRRLLGPKVPRRRP
ncbi:MAG: N-acetylmuramic acid 6-phosphate etherase [Deltaproteobacteria bacterium]|nr:N-acetylmuramic acid 6-phosphate etherase [Deltaproteobacteria bacterium]